MTMMHACGHEMKPGSDCKQCRSRRYMLRMRKQLLELADQHFSGQHLNELHEMSLKDIRFNLRRKGVLPVDGRLTRWKLTPGERKALKESKIEASMVKVKKEEPSKARRMEANRDALKVLKGEMSKEEFGVKWPEDGRFDSKHSVEVVS